jgi:2',3'-cyclic-nucleotide 2'-phosphodiesterase/3'-nucleotidase
MDIRRLKSLSVFCAIAALASPEAYGQDTVRVVVVASTDVHGRAYHWDYLTEAEAPWGITRAATVIDSLRAEYPGSVVVMDAGDLIQGSPFATYFARERESEVNPVVDALNAAGYDVATPGNHEFDFGVDVFRRAMGGAAFPVVSANIFRMPRDTFQFSPYAMLQRKGVRIGVTGFTTPGVMVWNRQKLAGEIEVRRIVPSAERALTAIDRAGAQLRIAIAHSGMSSTASYDTAGVGAENTARSLAFLPIKPHLVIVGHSHRLYVDSVINGVHFMQPQAWARSLAVAHIWLVADSAAGGAEAGTEQRSFRIVRIRGEEIPLANVPPHPVLTQRLERAHQSVRLWVATPLATIDGTWSAQYARAGDTPIIDFVNEVQRRVTGADLSATAAFNPRARFGPGDVRMRDVAAVYPYENTLRAIRIDGGVLKEFLEQSASYFEVTSSGEVVANDSIPGYNFDIVSGVEYTIDLGQPIGIRVRQLTRNGRLIQPNDTFTLAINSYRQEGGGGFHMLRGLPLVYDSEAEIRDLLTEWIRAADTLKTSDYFVPSWSLAPTEAEQWVRRWFGEPEVVGPAVVRPDPSVPIFAPLDTVQIEPEPPEPSTVPIAELKLGLERMEGEHALGWLVADGYRNGARTQFAIVSSQSMHADLPGGAVTPEHLAAVLAEDEPLVRLLLPGQLLFEMLEHVVSGDTPLAHVSGLEAWYDPEREPGRRLRRVWFPDGQEVERGETYTLGVVRSIALGSAGFTMLGEIEPGGTGLTGLEALLSYLPRLQQPIDPPWGPRFHSTR